MVFANSLIRIHIQHNKIKQSTPTHTHIQIALRIRNTNCTFSPFATWRTLDVIVANARTNAQDPALVHARFSAPNLILVLCPLSPLPYKPISLCVCMCECVYACFSGSLVYNFKVGLSQQRVEASGPRVGVCCEGHHKKNVLLKSGQMYVSLLQLIMASRITDFCSLFDFLSIPLTGSIQPQLASRFGLSFILLLQPL